MSCKIFNLFLFLSFTAYVHAQDLTSSSQDLYERRYDEYKESRIQHRRYKYHTIKELIDMLNTYPKFKKRMAGRSVEQRPIYHISWGSGDIDILFWTQMHGNEPTATMALFDFFNYLKDESFDAEFKAMVYKKCTLHFLPLLNPDGAERYSRYTALGIDMNRDALRRVHPESRILKELRDHTQAEWGFNLHDQHSYYSAGFTDKSARFSFLAPAYDEEKSVNNVRGEAMQLIAQMNHYLQKRIGPHVGRYYDGFEPRAFGDNMQKWGTRTILIESGGAKNDPEKQKNREVHYGIYRLAIQSIMNREYEEYDQEDYESIPFNANRMCDLLIKNLQILKDGQEYRLDLAIKRLESNTLDANDFYYESKIVDMGDLSNMCGYQELDATGYEVDFDLKRKAIKNLEELKKMDERELIDNRELIIECIGLPSPEKMKNSPFIVVEKGSNREFRTIDRDANPSFFLTKDGKKEYLISNGRLFPLTDR